jgi:DMSO/TMAO reductase YedYZ heme-binding membrane subunit
MKILKKKIIQHRLGILIILLGVGVLTFSLLHNTQYFKVFEDLPMEKFFLSIGGCLIMWVGACRIIYERD